MTFLNPTALWALLGLVPLIALYFLKVRPDRKPTTTLFLWNRIYKEKKQNGLFKNLRDLISLILLILAFSALALAMGKPVFTPKDSKRDLVLIIDNSASMSTLENNQTRLEEAKTKAKNIVKSLTSSQNVVIASAADSVKILTNVTNNQRALLKGIEQITTTELPLKKRKLQTISENKEIMPDSRFIFISDGCFEGYSDLKDLELIKVGKEAANIGITAFDLQQMPSSDGSIGLFFQLTSSLSSPQDIEVLLAHGTPENIVKIIPVTVRHGINKPEILNFSDNRTGRWFLKIDHQDALAADNFAYAQLNPPSPLRINLDVPANQPFFRLCVEAFRSSGQLMKVDPENPEISISFSGQNTGKRKVIFNPSGESSFWKGELTAIDAFTPKIVISDHPAIRHSALDTLSFTGAKKIEAPENSIILVETEEKVPLLYKTTVDGTVAYVVNLDPKDSQLYYSIYFPIIIYSLSYDLAGKEANKQVNFSTGSQLKVATNQTVTGPQGEVEVSNDQYKVTHSGFYNQKNEKFTESFAVSLLNKFESSVSNIDFKSSAKPIEASFPATDLLLILALILITGECMLYHRRKVG